jgi:hypothetical protein
MRRLSSVIVSLAVLAVAASYLMSQSSAQETKKKSPELQVLHRFVGQWHGKGTITNADGEEKTVEDDATMKWVLGGSYVEDRIGDTLVGFWTYEPTTKVYRCWYFTRGSRKPFDFTLKWNAEAASFSGKGDLDNGVTMTTNHKFIGDDKFEFSVIAKNVSGDVVFKQNGVKTRK